MEIIKKIKNKKEYKLNNDSIINELLFAHTITEKKILPKEVTQQIILYRVALDNKDINKLPDIINYKIQLKKEFQDAWFADDTPIIDYYYTTTEQKKLMRNILATKTICMGPKTVIMYFLKSSTEYKLFVTLPKKLRDKMAFFCMNNTIGVVQQSKWYNNIPYNMGTVIKLKWIIPEDEDKKEYLPKILLRRDSWYYYIY